VLIAAALLAMIAANSALAESYFGLLHVTTGPVLVEELRAMTVQLWINDGLMAIFFLLVGLELKREFVDGQLASWERRRLPFIAAATDIAFAIGVLALLGSRAPPALKLFLTTVAIIAVAYTDHLNVLALVGGIGFTMSLFIGGLAFPGNAALMNEMKLGVLCGSILSGITGYLALRSAPQRRKSKVA